jgi:hypothetical protein
MILRLLTGAALDNHVESQPVFPTNRHCEEVLLSALADEAILGTKDCFVAHGKTLAPRKDSFFLFM